MDQNRRNFLKSISTAATVLAGQFHIGGINVLSPSGLDVGGFTAVGNGKTLEDAAFWAGSFAMEIGSARRDNNYVTQLLWKRKCLEACSPEHVTQVKKHMGDAIDWYAAIPHNVDTLGPLARQAGERETLRLLNLPQAEFEAELQRQLQTSGESSKQQSTQAKPQEKEPLSPAKQAKHLAIRWDTIDGATTRRIKITVPGTHYPQGRLAEMAGSLRAHFPRDDIDLNENKNRIYIRNPSKAVTETLKPYLLQKSEHRQR